MRCTPAKGTQECEFLNTVQRAPWIREKAELQTCFFEQWVRINAVFDQHVTHELDAMFGKTQVLEQAHLHDDDLKILLMGK
ncbi:hypothetical protein A8B82_22285 [Sulfitobacter sp. EhC04]|nr:hypothetical protein A8B82_22285 [Sulfitobacter sp. EhC04]